MADESCMAELIESRWTRYGKDRVYVKTADGIDFGHVDLIVRTVAPTEPSHELELLNCFRRWTVRPEDASEPSPSAALALHSEADLAPRPEQVSHPESTTDTENTVPLPIAAPTHDHAGNVAGAAVRAKHAEVNAQAPVKNFVARLLGVKTDERAWRVGAKGEEKVAKELAKLGPDWRVLHAVEVGTHGSDIDHVVIGPPGVFTLNAKRHPNAKAWVGEHAVRVNGRPTHYLRNARFEAKRASKLLTAACGFGVIVRSVVVFVDLTEFDVKKQPADVHIATRRRLIPWLEPLPPSLDHDTIEAIYAKARLSSTWQFSSTWQR